MTKKIVEDTTNHKVGRPLKYQSVEELQVLIDAYFEDCKGKPFIKENGEPMIGKDGEILMIGSKPPVITGLALALDMTRQMLIDYQEKNEFTDTITHAKQKCELFAESCLFTKSSANGPSFNLKNNYGWKDKTEVEQTTNVQFSKLEDFF